MSSTTTVDTEAYEHYYVPSGSIWPVALTAGLLLMAVGGASWMNGAGWGSTTGLIGLVMVIGFAVIWFRDVIAESITGKNSAQMGRTYRWGMGWFIFSEVMFFAAFFGALFYGRSIAVPFWAGADLESHLLLYPQFDGGWPTNGPGNEGGNFTTMSPWPLPLANTLILLTSGMTLTWAHHGLLHAKRAQLNIGLAITVALGSLFMVLQAVEYYEAYQHLNLTMETGIYGATFFMLTGFHGAHVTLGAIMLAVMLGRSLKGHFTADDHFGFEAAAWYWHFVDVVWIGLFIFVYILV